MSEWGRGCISTAVMPSHFGFGQQGKIRRKQLLGGLVLFVDVDVDVCTVPAAWSRRRLKIDVT